MRAISIAPGLSKPDTYRELREQFGSIIDGERDGLANCANAAALLFHGLPDLNWAGFYLLRGDELVLGPFQGRVACVRIGLGRGVCGTAAQRGSVVIVPDVHAFPGHIACDAASRSEIVLPLVGDGRVLGVLDLDSPLPGRFDEEDAAGLGKIADLLVAGSDWERLTGPP